MSPAALTGEGAASQRTLADAIMLKLQQQQAAGGAGAGGAQQQELGCARPRVSRLVGVLCALAHGSCSLCAPACTACDQHAGSQCCEAAATLRCGALACRAGGVEGLDERVIDVYKGVGQLLARYTNGKVRATCHEHALAR